MFVSGPNAPRRTALPVPTQARSARVHPVQDTEAHTSDSRRRETPAQRRSDPALPRQSVSQVSSASGVRLQAANPHPRRGLRADASERQRYARAYARAQSVVSPSANMPPVIKERIA